MKLFSFYNDKFKILNFTLFKFRPTKTGIYFYFLGIKLFKCKTEISKLIEEIYQNKSFDMRDIDNQIAKYTQDITPDKIQTDKHKITFFATELYDTGGHSKCISNLIKSLDGEYEQKLFLTDKYNTYKNAANTIKEITKHAQVVGIDTNLTPLKLCESAKKISDLIIQYAPCAINVYIHPNDIIGAAVLSIIKKTGIKIIFHNHASHFPDLGMSFADVILEGMPSTVKFTNEKRHLYNTKIIGLQSYRKDETVYYPQSELNKLKEQMGIKKDALITMSGGTSYKFFDKNGGSEYFEMILHILKKEKNLCHVVITELKYKEKSIVDNIFANAQEEKKRLIIIPFQKDFDKYFQLADVFIDSFPVSSALTQIDLMRNKTASVVKINNQNPQYSFQEYQMPNYPYMFEKTEDIENAVIELLYNKEKREEIIAKNYDFWLKTYESNVFKDKIIDIIEGVLK